MAFEGFDSRRVETGECEIACFVGGAGPPALPAARIPADPVHVAQGRAEARGTFHTVVASDLRGYGDSGRVADGENHSGYCKRAAARDQVAVMESLGFSRFALVGHDRGGRVAHRLALDHPQAVERLSVLDIAPTRTVFANADKALATRLLSLVLPDPARTAAGTSDRRRPRILPALHDRQVGRPADAFTDEAMAEYIRSFSRPETIHATAEDYRAGATIDLEHDEADIDRRLQCPVQALWGAEGVMERLFDVLACWRERAVDVRGRALPCGPLPPRRGAGGDWRRAARIPRRLSARPMPPDEDAGRSRDARAAAPLLRAAAELLS